MNGWTNYQTWAVVTWGYDSIEDDEYRDVIGRSIDTGAKILKLSEYLRERFAELLENEYNRLNGLLLDLLTEAAERINWYEVAAAIVTDREDDDSVDE